MKLVRTPRINELVAKKGTTLEKFLKPGKIGNEWIDHREAVDLSKSHGIPLREFLRGTGVYHAPSSEKIEQQPKSAEYVKLMDRLRKEQAEKEYQELVHSNSDKSSFNLAQINREVNSQLTTIFNVLVSVLAIAWAFWYWCASWPLPARTLISMTAGIFVGVAEVVVFSGYQRRLAQSKAKNSVEKQEVLSQLIFTQGKQIEEPAPTVEKKKNNEKEEPDARNFAVRSKKQPQSRKRL